MSLADVMNSLVEPAGSSRQTKTTYFLLLTMLYMLLCPELSAKYQPFHGALRLKYGNKMVLFLHVFFHDIVRHG
ncbi:uncharacterized protein PHALS_14585 [Plasmopara halstedii]|uniref:Uncharacterized protein n=1 Tax=Plasmopara halstedii TaxID=4781 RepID=A0A0P1AKN9_PLAHL|nr:uncharacterized protein PHALS_14585 [Plasmopara halstedii]CEG41956.1 hypothetical protein PHALS_14585 [Plasmopara halstedii]|eukprot:XP_024578325.1 hypothetical protein PHALS_14585 [Plasmopara halstedii]